MDRNDYQVKENLILTVWNQKCPFLPDKFSFTFSPLLGSFFVPLYPVKTYTVSLSCPFPARLIKGCSWGAFQQTLCNPSADNSKILCNPIPWHRSELLPDISIKPRCGKMFPQRCYTPVTTCGGKEACDTVGHQLGTGKYYIFILPPPYRRWKNLLCGVEEKRNKRKTNGGSGDTWACPWTVRKGKCILYLQSLHNWSVQPDSLFVFSLSFSLLYFGLNEFSHPYPNTQLSLLQIFNVSGRRNVESLPESSPTAATSSLSSVIYHLYRNPQLWV